MGWFISKHTNRAGTQTDSQVAAVHSGLGSYTGAGSRATSGRVLLAQREDRGGGVRLENVCFEGSHRSVTASPTSHIIPLTSGQLIVVMSRSHMFKRTCNNKVYVRMQKDWFLWSLAECPLPPPDECGYTQTRVPACVCRVRAVWTARLVEPQHVRPGGEESYSFSWASCLTSWVGVLFLDDTHTYTPNPVPPLPYVVGHNLWWLCNIWTFHHSVATTSLRSVLQHVVFGPPLSHLFSLISVSFSHPSFYFFACFHFCWSLYHRLRPDLSSSPELHFFSSFQPLITPEDRNIADLVQVVNYFYCCHSHMLSVIAWVEICIRKKDQLNRISHFCNNYLW